MVITASGLKDSLNQMIDEMGTQLRFRYFTKAFPGGGSSYDDEITISRTGTDIWTSGLVQPLNKDTSSQEAQFVEQGHLLMNDVRCYVSGIVDTSGLFIVGIGSPPDEEHRGIEELHDQQQVAGGIVYKKLFLRVLSTGSLD